MADIFVISGPNGSGKTTSAMSLFPDLLECMEFVNADSIASGISPFQPEIVAIEAGRIMLQRMRKLEFESKDFAFETTLSSRSFSKFLQQCQKSGYTITLLYVWVNAPELAIQRVQERVQRGGHSIPEDIVKRRYFRSINNLFDLYLNIVDNAFIFDNSLTAPVIIAEKAEGGNIEILNLDVWQALEKMKNETCK